MDKALTTLLAVTIGFALGVFIGVYDTEKEVTALREQIATLTTAPAPSDQTSLGIYARPEEAPVKWAMKYQTKGDKQCRL